MDITELCKLCSKYESNKFSLKLERSFKEDVNGRWYEDSAGMKNIVSKINYLEQANKRIEEKISVIIQNKNIINKIELEIKHLKKYIKDIKTQTLRNAIINELLFLQSLLDNLQYNENRN